MVSSKIHVERNRGLGIVKMILKNRVYRLVETFRTSVVEIMIFLGKNRPRKLNREFRNRDNVTTGCLHRKK